MSTNSKKKITMGKRYTDAEKREVVSFAQQVNADNGRGGQAAAARKFGISVLTVSAWLKASAKAASPAKVVKVAQVAKPAQVAKVAKPVKVAKVAKPVKKLGKKRAPQGKRYSDEQKKAVLDLVVAVNAKKGRGGLSAATKKFRISPLTISSWLRKSGLTMPKAVKAVKPVKAARVKSGVSAKLTTAISKQIAKAEKDLAKLKVMIGSLK